MDDLNLFKEKELTEDWNMVVLAEKDSFKGALFGHISCGGGILALSHGISLKFIALDDKFVKIQVLHTGIGQPIKSQTWIKSKKVEKKGNQSLEEVKLTDEIEVDEVI